MFFICFTARYEMYNFLSTNKVLTVFFRIISNFTRTVCFHYGFQYGEKKQRKFFTRLQQLIDTAMVYSKNGFCRSGSTQLVNRAVFVVDKTKSISRYDEFLIQV